MADLVTLVPVTTLKRAYPHVEGILDWSARMSVRLLWDRVWGFEERLQTLEANVKLVAAAVNALNVQLLATRALAQQAYALTQSPSTSVDPAAPPPAAPDAIPPAGAGMVPPPPPAGAVDNIDLTSVIIFNSPPDIASWPVTSQITGLVMRPSASPTPGLAFSFSTQDTWPNAIPAGWQGGVQYTVWAVVNIGGQWYTSGFIEMWKGRPNTGAPILTDFASNWAYDARWGPMNGHHPVVGEQMGFFLSAGDARGRTEPTSVRERTNIVLANLPAGDSGTFSY